jgi:hypothetical protein
MPSVNLSPETYEKLKALAHGQGRSPDEAAESLLDIDLRARSLSAEEWRAEFRRVRQQIQAEIPPELTDEEIQAEIDQAIAEVRADRCARGN